MTKIRHFIYGSFAMLAVGLLIAAVTPINPLTCSAGNFFTSMDNTGTFTCAAPAAANGGLFNQVMSATPTSASTGFTTWINQGTATTSNGATGMSMTDTGSTDHIRLLKKTPPGTPYTIKALLAVTTAYDTANGECGLGFSDGTKFEFFLLHANRTISAQGTYQFGVIKYSNSTTFSAWYGATGGNSYPLGLTNPIMWVQIVNNGTTVAYQISMDGVNFVTETTVTISGSFLGAGNYSNVGLIVNDTTTFGTTCTLLSYAES